VVKGGRKQSRGAESLLEDLVHVPALVLCRFVRLDRNTAVLDQPPKFLRVEPER
jgi:hypothetical protein